MKEIWKDIDGYDGFYKISNKGKIYSVINKKILKNQIVHGYEHIELNKKGYSHQYQVHRLVALAFIPNPNNYSFINHKDENKCNNSVENLEWCTSEYNNTYNNRAIRAGETYRSKHYTRSDEIKKAISIANTGRHHTKETKTKISESMKNREVSDETKRKLSLKLKKYYKIHKRIVSGTTKEKLSFSLKGKKKPERSEEHKKHLSNSLKGRKFSEEVIQNRANTLFILIYLKTHDVFKTPFNIDDGNIYDNDFCATKDEDFQFPSFKLMYTSEEKHERGYKGY